MRTIKLEAEVQADATQTYRISTEVIIDDDSLAAHAGREARGVIEDFMNGYAEDPRV